MKWPNLFGRRHSNGQAPTCTEDFLLVTWDSCRFDAYQKARTPILDQFGPAHRAWAMATYTLPAHVALFHGFLPHAFEATPFYNRYYQQLWRISHRKTNTQPLVSFPPGTKNLADGFANMGYYTVGTAAMSMFRHAPMLRRGFDDFTVTKEQEARQQNQIIIKAVRSNAASKPFFAFINYGETHSPFHHEDMPGFDPQAEEHFSYSRLHNQQGVTTDNWTFNQTAFDKQVSCAEFLDARMGDLLAFLKERGKPATVVMCADHGECFGENGLYGHAFYHEKVMEVPLLIFRVNAPPHPMPIIDNAAALQQSSTPAVAATT
jgi:membrane-anchored protein YejM (alkaline phosphatase superfamily)